MRPNREQDLPQIIRGCCRQDQSCQHDLYKLYYAYGMSICLRYADNEETAIHILNDGFLKVFRHIRKYDPDRPFKPWLRIVLVHAAITHVKRHPSFKNMVSMEEAKNIPAKEDIHSRINYAELMEMVQSLSVGYRTVFNLYVIDGFKHEEIARKLGISVGTSKSNLSKARARLRDLVNISLKKRYV